MADKKPKKIVHRTLQLSRAKTKSSLDNFFGFIRSQGVVGIAIGFIIGTQARLLVDQFSASLINPLLGLIVGTGEGLSNKKFYLTFAGQTATFEWGAFLYSFINFLIVLLIVYLVYKWLRLDRLAKKPQ